MVPNFKGWENLVKIVITPLILVLVFAYIVVASFNYLLKDGHYGNQIMAIFQLMIGGIVGYVTGSKRKNK